MMGYVLFGTREEKKIVDMSFMMRYIRGERTNKQLQTSHYKQRPGINRLLLPRVQCTTRMVLTSTCQQIWPPLFATMSTMF